MDLWLHNEIREDALFCFRRITEQAEYIREVRNSDRSPERKAELIDSARAIKNRFKDKLGEYITHGLIASLNH